MESLIQRVINNQENRMFYALDLLYADFALSNNHDSLNIFHDVINEMSLENIGKYGDITIFCDIRDMCEKGVDMAVASAED